MCAEPQDVLIKLTDDEKNMILAFARNDMKYCQTAREYFISHNGFRYHLRKIHAKTGLNPTKFADLMRLVILIASDKEEK